MTVTKTVLSLFAIYEISLSQIIGPNGQNCTTGIDDNPPDACPMTSNNYAAGNGNGGYNSFTSLTGDEIECEENFDCCLCASITCGAANGPYCEKFVANGDSSAFYVSNIAIYGDPDDGTEIDCNGDDSCAGTEIEASGIKEIKCSGDGSCANAAFSIACIADDGCDVECSGNSGCEDIDIAATNVRDLKCGGRQACKNSSIGLTCNGDDACNIECDSDEACAGASIILNNVEQVVCGAVDSCKDARITVTNPVNDFELQCKSPGACQGATIVIDVPETSKVKKFKGIQCESDSACQGAQIAVINNGQKDIKIEELDCQDAGACTDAVFDFNSGSRAVTIEECECGDSLGCLGVTGLDSCAESLEKLECTEDLCRDQVITITNPENDFEIKCDDENACRGLDLTIVVNDDAADGPITDFKGIKCGDRKSCSEAKFTIDNQQTDGTPINIEKIECDGKKSCKLTTFLLILSYTNADVDLPEIDCEGSNACDACTINSNPCKSSGSGITSFSALIKGNDADNVAMNGGENNDETHNVMIEFSPFLWGNIWGAVGLFAAVCITLSVCCNKRNKEAVHCDV